MPRYRHPENIEAALDELRAKSIEEIQVETARKWAERACAAVLLGLADDAREYAHEALEHAALVDDNGQVFFEVRELLARHGAKGN